LFCSRLRRLRCFCVLLQWCCHSGVVTVLLSQ
jgi:hypothetical protein